MKRIHWLAIALLLSLVEASPQCRADSIRIGVAAQAHAYPPGEAEIHDQASDPPAGQSAPSASASAKAGPYEASVSASGQITRNGYSGQLIYRASTSATAEPKDTPGFAEAGAVGTAEVNVTAPAEIVPLYVAYGVSAKNGLQENAHLIVSGAESITIGAGQSGIITGYASGDSAGIFASFPTIGGAGMNSTLMSVIWGAGELPGLRKDNPLLAGRWNKNGGAADPPPPPTPDDGTGTSAGGAADVTGSYFHVPVSHGYGLGGLVYLDPAFARGYLYQVEGTRFAQFTIPDPLPGGDADFQLAFGGQFYDYHAGDIFDFTRYNPEGLSAFYLLGIDESEMIDTGTHAPFVSGLSFTTEGVAQVWQTPLVGSAVPEPSSLVMLGLGGCGAIVEMVRRRPVRRTL